MRDRGGPRAQGAGGDIAASLQRAFDLRAQGRLSESVEACRAILEVAPSDVNALHAMGVILGELGELDQAAAFMRKAMGLRPDLSQVRVNLAKCLIRSHALEEAEMVLREALACPDNQGYGYEDLAHCFYLQGRRATAEAALHEYAAHFPDKAGAHYGLGSLTLARQDPEAAIAHFERALRIDPSLTRCLAPLIQAKMEVCEWQGLAELITSARQAARDGAAMSPFHYQVFEPDPDLQRANAERWWSARALRSEPARDFMLDPDKSPLAIGYLSGDFHEHATAYLTAELFALHDRRAFRVIGYSYGLAEPGPTRRRLERGFDIFREVSGSTSTEIADQIRADGVDILIDLKGFTRDSRPEILALRPAPVLIHYLGYPGTLGGAVDYLIADSFVIPSTRSECFSEVLALMARCYQINDPHRTMVVPPARSAVGLPADGLVLCCFNSPYKITAAVFDVWMRLLHAHPSAVLWLLGPNARIVANLRNEAAQRGIDPARLVFASFEPHARHLGRYQLADLFLDTFPVTAHTTASECLWAGCPLLTCAGDSFITRVAGSILMSLGLSELVAASLEEYEAKAQHLLSSPADLAALKATVAAQRNVAPVFDAPGTTRALEGLYRLCWRHRAGAMQQG